MLILVLFAFLAGIVTILSPCILPILPIVLSSSVEVGEENKKKPYGIVIGFIISFTIFTLFLSSIVKSFNISADTLRTVAVLVIGFFGLTLLIPKIQALFENLFSKISRFAPDSSKKKGFWGGMLIGFSLGLLWTPCVGPILASVISLALIGDVTLGAVFITLAYSVGTAIPMLGIIMGGKNIFSKFPKLNQNLGRIQMAFGLLMVLTAAAIALNYDRKFQTYILKKFPAYGRGLTSLEDNKIVEKKLTEIKGGVQKEDMKDGFLNLAEMNEKNAMNLPRLGKAPELIPSGRWYNSEPLTLEDLRGKVVLLDFWTYSCINCQRTFPYLRDWWEKYQDEGLVIIGAHAPEFEFEKDPDNVAEAIQDFNLQYPIFQDNEFKTWRAYHNRYWPAKYIIGHEGYIRYKHFGEGKYDETEKVIQALLKEAGAADVEETISNPGYRTYARTPETYLGYARIANFASPEKVVMGEYSAYSKPEKLRNGQFAYEGEWLISPEYANPKANSNLYFNFEAKEVFLVMRPKNGQSQVKIYLDGQQNSLGEDVSADGVVNINKDTLYKLIKLGTPGKHLLRIEFLDDNTEIYAFTFG
jgi:cytochrome c biogenesis protein CcdA/thiol-disulfide isomerase/thioredoxin